MNVTIADPQVAAVVAAAQLILTGPAERLPLCPIRDILDRIGDKWTNLVVLNLGAAGCLRFSTLRQRIEGLSQRMLTMTLRSLEADGLVRRTVYAQVPPRVEYELTTLGYSLLALFVDLGNWATQYAPAIATSRGQGLR